MEIIKYDIQKLKELNTSFSYYLLGRSYDLEENGAEQDYDKALYYYQKGFELNYPLCIYSLGISYELGLGNLINIDKEKAKSLLVAAYPRILDIIKNTLNENEKTYAKFVIGAYYYFGLGDVQKDYNKAFTIIKECADEGHIAAIYDLGANFYYNGNGTDVNYELAEHYLNIAKDNGLKRAKDLYETRFQSKR